MKRIFVFMGLKIVEISGCLVVLFIGMKISDLFVSNEDLYNPYYHFFLGGVAGIGAIAICAMVVVGLYFIIKNNWQWAKRIAEKK